MYNRPDAQDVAGRTQLTELPFPNINNVEGLEVSVSKVELKSGLGVVWESC